MSLTQQQQDSVSSIFECLQKCNDCIRFSRITDDLAAELPNLESLVLTGNNLQELGDIDPLAKLTKLTSLSLLTNPMASKKQYREYVIFK
jgi:U2 small nuclear ribonucleoprotein A'